MTYAKTLYFVSTKMWTPYFTRHWPQKAESNKEEKMASPNTTLYIYAVFKTELRDSINGNITDPAELLVSPTPVVAYTEDQARAVASRAIPENETEDMSRIVVLVRPF